METSLSHTLSVLADAKALGTATADRIVSILRQAIRQRGRASLALSGGNTPHLYLPLLAEEPRLSALPWKDISVFWADERCVPPNDPESNYGMADRLLFSRAPVPSDNIHRMRGELPPERAAVEYRAALATLFGGTPVIDLVVLGIGSDGHTASLFPGSAALAAKEPVYAVHVPHLDSWRVTLTLPVLNNARNILFCVSGTAKAGILKKILSAETRTAYPAGRVMPTDGSLFWLIDSAAGRFLA